tara:strand:- start:135 stop:1007 length:873 start_codon:yes stop_codon:yes gene_type:complete
MSEINIPNIESDNITIQNIPINETGIKLIQSTDVRPIGNNYIQDSRVWLITPPQAIPTAVPVTTVIGTPVVDMPGCVKIHKENSKRDPSRNKNLVNDDPKGNTILCDAGAPYYEPADYDYRDLTWQTVYQDEPEAEGVDVGEAPAPEIDPPEPPPTPSNKKEIECPPINARRIGDLNAAGTERVKEYKLTPDKLICETIWEPVPTMEQFVPSIPVVSTTATIAAVATTSALLAKPLADLILKVVKPVVKKAIAKVQKMLGKTPYRPTQSDIVRDRYREKKGLPPLKVKKN